MDRRDKFKNAYKFKHSHFNNYIVIFAEKGIKMKADAAGIAMSENGMGKTKKNLVATVLGAGAFGCGAFTAWQPVLLPLYQKFYVLFIEN